MTDPALFRRLPFSAGVTAGLLSYLVLFGTLFVVPFFLERSLGLSTGQAGLELTVMAIVLGVVAPFAGRMADRWGPRPLTVAGMLLVAGALVVLGLSHPGTPGRLVELGVLGAGLGLFTPPNNAAIMASAPRSQAGVASGILNMTRGIGTAMGLAFTSLVFGIVAGTHQIGTAAATRGFEASALFLAALALLAGALAALRGRTAVNVEPLAST
jgi:MFS family permease